MRTMSEADESYDGAMRRAKRVKSERDALRDRLMEAEHFGFECQGTYAREFVLSPCGYVVKGDDYPDECPHCGQWGQDWAYLSYFMADSKKAPPSGGKDAKRVESS